MSATPGVLRSDPAATRDRVARLREYLTADVLGPHGLACSSGPDCRRSALRRRDGSPRPDVSFAEAQLPHVGAHYDLTESGRPLRILIVGMEMGEAEQHVSLDRRTEQIQLSVGLAMTRRNPHMQGVTNALRIALGRGPGRDRVGELLDLDPPVHVFNACATTNVRLCSAYSDGRKSKGTPLMTRHCLRHLAETVRILAPTLVVTQGTRIDLSPVLDGHEEMRPHLSRVAVRGTTTLLAEFSHPTAQGALRWGGINGVPYLYDVVAPVLRDARRLLLA